MSIRRKLNKLYKGKTGYGIDESNLGHNAIGTYGEITYNGIDTILKGLKKKDKVFMDIGSGIGKSVMYAGLKYPFEKSIGIEVSKNRHKIATQVRRELNNKNIKTKGKNLFSEDLSCADIIWISNLCFTEKMNKDLAKKLKKELKKGTIVFSSKELPKCNKVSDLNVQMTWNNSSSVKKYVF